MAPARRLDAAPLVLLDEARGQARWGDGVARRRGDGARGVRSRHGSAGPCVYIDASDGFALTFGTALDATRSSNCTSRVPRRAVGQIVQDDR